MNQNIVDIKQKCQDLESITESMKTEINGIDSLYKKKIYTEDRKMIQSLKDELNNLIKENKDKKTNNKEMSKAIKVDK